MHDTRERLSLLWLFALSELSSGVVDFSPDGSPELKVPRSNRGGRTTFSNDLADPSPASEPRVSVFCP